MKRINVSILLIMTICFSCLTACGRGENPNSEPGIEPAQSALISVTVCGFEKYSRRYGMDERAAAAGIRVDDAQAAAGGDFFAEIENGSDQYDIFLVYGEEAGSKRYWDEHLYEDLSASPILVETVNRMYESVGGPAWSGEELMGMPMDAGAAVLAYQEEVFSQLSDPKPLDAWDDLLALAENLPQGMTVFANNAGLRGCLFNQYLAGYGRLSDTPPYSVDYDTDAFRAVLDDMKRISACGAFQESEMGAASYGSDDDFRQTDILGINRWLDLRSIHRPGKLPDIESGVTIPPQIQIIYAVVNPHSPRREAAIRYLETLASAEAYLQNGNLFPDGSHKEQEAYMREAEVFYEFGIYSGVSDILDDFINGKIGAEEAISLVQQRTDEILGEYGDKK